jgi:hypothetical protein
MRRESPRIVLGRRRVAAPYRLEAQLRPSGANALVLVEQLPACAETLRRFARRR